MNDLGTLLAIVAYTAVVVMPPIVLSRIVSDSETDSSRPPDAADDEPVRWRVERLSVSRR